MTRPQKAVQSRAWQRMLSGRRLDLLDPSPFDIEIEDIAHGLARVARWNGQTHGDHAFSVAQHCLVVEELVGVLKPGFDRRWRLAALLHDAPEYVVGDLISPFKAAVGLDYKTFENKLLSAIHMRFALPSVLPADVTSHIKRTDTIAAHIEAVQLAGFSVEEANSIFGVPRGAPAMKLLPMPAPIAQRKYIERFTALAETTKPR